MGPTLQSQRLTPTEPATAAPAPADVAGPLRSRRPLALGLAAAVVSVAAAAGGWALITGTGSPAPVGARPTTAPAAYAPGGSVYTQQVPALARGGSLPVPSAYAPGGSVYDQQVPTP